MTAISALPSPHGTNREQLYILRGGARRTSPKAAYDERGGFRRGAYDDVDPAQQIAAWAFKNLDIAAQSRLVEMLSARPAQDEDDSAGGIEGVKAFIRSRLKPADLATFEKMVAALGASARDESADPSLNPDGDPNATFRRKSELNAGAPALDAMVARALRKQFGRTVVEPRAPSAEVVSIVERIGVQPMERDPHERRAIATDSKRLASLEKRFPGISSIGFA